jgi:tetratricopeptide (TPR) repeat protein
MGGHEIFGVGGGNGALFTLEHIDDVPDQQLIARTYNWALQVFLQNGLLGLIVFAIIPVASLISAQRLIKGVDDDPQMRQNAILIQGAIGAMLVSDLTYTSVVLHPPVMCLFFGLAGAINGRQPRGIGSQRIAPVGRAQSYGTVTVVLLVSLYFGVFGLRRSYSEIQYSHAAHAMQDNDYNLAIAHLVVAENNSRCDALYRSMKGLVLVRSLGDDAAFMNVWQRGYVMPQKDRGRIVDALRAYQDASECAPMDAELHSNLAWLDVMLGDDRTARVQLDIAKEIEPETGFYHLSSGLLYEREGHLENAYDEYSTAIAYSPHILESEFFSQLSRRSESESERVAGDAMTVLANTSDSPIRTAELARLSYARDSYASTKRMLTVALSQLPALSYPWYTLGEIAETEGDGRGAILDYRRSLFMDPMNRATLARLAIIESAMGDNYEGLQAAEAAVMLTPASEHAVESEMMYGMNTLSSDDVLPSGLLGYTLPRIRVESLCKIIYQNFGIEGLEVPPDVIDRIHVLGGSC